MNRSGDPSSSASAQPAGRAGRWDLPGGPLKFGRRPRLMGVINVTPDSFSDGGRFFDPAAAVQQGLALAEQGADILDVGGESTRPRSAPVAPEEELRRVLPVVAGLCRETSVPVSIDTSKAAVAREALAAGAQIINDVTGLAGDEAMLPLAVESSAAVCVMHMQGTPQTMQEDPTYEDVVLEVLAYLRDRRDHLIAAGIAPARIALDPGIGFGKTTAHNLSVLAAARQFHELGCPILVGPSRKRFIGDVLADLDTDRTAGTIAAALSLAQQGVQVIRVHDVGPLRQALALFEATGGLE